MKRLEGAAVLAGTSMSLDRTAALRAVLARAGVTSPGPRGRCCRSRDTQWRFAFRRLFGIAGMMSRIGVLEAGAVSMYVVHWHPRWRQDSADFAPVKFLSCYAPCGFSGENRGRYAARAVGAAS
jgi:hypothetical protein